MVNISKRVKEFEKVVEKDKKYTLEEAIDTIATFPKVKFGASANEEAAIAVLLIKCLLVRSVLSVGFIKSGLSCSI